LQLRTSNPIIRTNSEYKESRSFFLCLQKASLMARGLAVLARRTAKDRHIPILSRRLNFGNFRRRAVLGKSRLKAPAESAANAPGS
jgi:hypothetical protein